jgi:thiamine-phosphate diphosphorylase
MSDFDQNNQNSHRYLCIITEPNACDSMEHVKRTIETLQSALGTHNDHSIDLIAIRVIPPIKHESTLEYKQFLQRLIYLSSQLMAFKRKHQHHPLYNNYHVVMNDVQYLQAAIEAHVDGIHVKEKDTHQIPHIRSVFHDIPNRTSPVIIGTSAHSSLLALQYFEEYSPNYMFVGTCYKTQSHPEKDIHMLEGPKLPGIVKRSILQHLTENYKVDQVCPPIIYAIGGIEKSNCLEPLQYGADGVAVIRAVMQSCDPETTVKELKECMYGINSRGAK